MTLCDLPLRCLSRTVAIHNGQIDCAFCLPAAQQLLQRARSQMLSPVYWVLDNGKLTLHCRDWKDSSYEFSMVVG